MQGLPGKKNSGMIKVVILLVIAAVVVYFLSKQGIIKLPFELPF